MSEQHVKVSVIIPVYNNELYLYDTLMSIQKQTFSDFEVIVVNDGSQDGSEKIIDQFVSSDQRFIKINQENKGVSAARNNALKVAKGEYVTFVDGDDTIPANALQEMDNIARNYQPDLIIGGIQRMDGSVKKINARTKKLKYKRDLGKDDLDMVHGLSMCNKWFKKSVIDEHNLQVEPFRHLEDGVFLYDFLQYADGIGYCDSVIYNYIKRVPIHEGSVTQRVEKGLLESAVKAFERMKELTADYPEEFKQEMVYRVNSTTFIGDYYKKIWRLDKETEELLIKQICDVFERQDEKYVSKTIEAHAGLELEKGVRTKEELLQDPVFTILIPPVVSEDKVNYIIKSLYGQSVPSFIVVVDETYENAVEESLKKMKNLTFDKLGNSKQEWLAYKGLLNYPVVIEKDVMFDYDTLTSAYQLLRPVKKDVGVEVLYENVCQALKAVPLVAFEEKKEEPKPVKKSSFLGKMKKSVKRILRKAAKHDDTQNKPKPGAAVLDYYFNYEVDEHIVLLEGIGKHVKGNILYIIRELKKEKYSDYKLYVSVKEDNKKQVELFLKQQGIEGVNLVVVESKKYKELLATAKYLFNEVYYPNYWVQKPEQCSVNIWHGTPLKKLGAGKPGGNIHGDGPAQRNFVAANYMLFPNEFTKENLLRDCYVDQLMMGEALMLGYPRTGRLLEITGEEEALRERLAGEKKQLIAYMPTYRDDDADGKQIEKILDLFECVEQELPEDSLMYVNLHHKMSGQINYARYSKIKQFPSDLDTYQVLSVVDCLCTDYSSLMFDFAPTRRKIVLYCYDLEEYITSRGVYLDMEELPFAKVRTAQEVVQAFQNEKQYDDSAFLEKFCKFDSKDNAAKLCECVIGGSRECVASKEEREVFKPILIYSDGWHPSRATDRMYQLAENEKWTKKVYLSYHELFVNNYLNSAYPLLNRFRSIGTKGDQLFTDEQKKVMSQYRADKISFEEMISKLEVSYKTERYRCYDRLPFEKVILWDTMNPDKIIGYSYFECEKYLFIQDSLLKELNRGNRYFCDAVNHFVKQGGKVLESVNDIETIL